MFKCPLGECVSIENNSYVRWSYHYNTFKTAFHLNDSSFTALHLKTSSIPKSEFRKIVVENTSIIAYEVNKLRLQILEALHIKTTKK